MIFTRVFNARSGVNQAEKAYATSREPIPGGSPSGIPAVDGRYSFFSSFATRLVALLCVIALASCGGMPSKPGKKSEKAPEQAEQPAGKDDVLEPLELIPNPYLQHKGSVPARAKEEFAKAQAAIKAKKYQQAVGLLTLMTETYPKLSGPYVNLGIANWKLGKLEEAENAFNFAIQTNQYNMDAYTQLGILYREQGKFAEAEQTYLSALKAWPHHLDSILNIGILYDMYMGKQQEALAYYKLGQRVAPEPDRKVKGWIVDLERRIASGQ